MRIPTSALSGEESRRFPGVDLEERGVRSIWVEIENRSDRSAWYFPLVPGVGAAPRDAPRHHLTGDPYFTDGQRLLLVMDSKPRSIDEIQLLIR
jgi:hypothetical protein